MTRPFRPQPDTEAESQAGAEHFRQERHLGVQPLGDLAAIIEQATGIDVAVLDVGPDEHGLTMRDPARSEAVFIGVARTRHPMRQRSTLAHQLAHVLFEDWTDDSGSWSERTPAESRADSFARHLLVPVDGVREFIGDRTTITQSILSAVVQRFLVSPAIAAIALNQAGYIDDATKQDWMTLSTPQLAAQFGWSDQYHALQGDSGQRRAPQRLLARAIKGYAEGVLSLRTIATLRAITVEQAESDLCKAGVVPSERSIAWATPAELPNVRVDLAALDDDLMRCTEAPARGEAAGASGSQEFPPAV